MCCNACRDDPDLRSGPIASLYETAASSSAPSSAPVAAENVEISVGTLDVMVWILAVIGAAMLIKRGLL